MELIRRFFTRKKVKVELWNFENNRNFLEISYKVKSEATEKFKTGLNHLEYLGINLDTNPVSRLSNIKF